MIPKVIHYCWFGENKLPKSAQKCIRSWKQFCPDYKIIQWNESNFNISSHPFMKVAYESKAWAFVSDYARLKILYENGGIYFDTDVELLKPIDELLKHECYLGIQQIDNRCNTGLGFGCEQNSKIIKALLDVYDEIVFNNINKIQLSCPFLNSKAIEPFGFKYKNQTQHIDGAVVYSSEYFDPIAPGNTQNLLNSNTISIHHYTATWMNKKMQLKRKIFNFIGQDKINEIRKNIVNKFKT